MKNSTIHALGCGSDFTVQDGGSVTILRAHNDECQEWMDSHLPSDAQKFGGGIVVEPRYLGPILEGLDEAGFTGKEI